VLCKVKSFSQCTPYGRHSILSPEQAMQTDRTMPRRATRVVLVAALILMVPLVAMQVSGQVAWTPFDFAVAGALLVGTGLAYELAASRARNVAYRAAVGLALAGALLLVWVDLAVGLIGSEDNPANLMYLGVLAIGIVGAILARLRPLGMARALLATALAQAAVAVIAVVLRLGAPANSPVELLLGNGLFVALFAGSASLFRHAARTK
jgi:hypothetical protein